jgi:hypothetical protein
MEALIERLVSEQPHFHAWPDGRSANWSVASDALRFLFEQVRPGMNTLETGAGQSTAVFGIAGAHHVAITPDRPQADRIRAYLNGFGISYDVTFIHESSDLALPAGRGIPERLDIVLIDGAHRFPFPILDWHYTEPRVPVGGLVAVDDYRMPSVRILFDFLAAEKEWELITTIGATAFFRKVCMAKNTGDWSDQNINKAHLEQAGRTIGPHQAKSRAPLFLQKLMRKTRAD